MRRNRLPFFKGSFCRTYSTYDKQADPKYVNRAQSGKDNFAKDFQKSHIKTNFFQKALLGLGSGVVSLTSPSRGDMIAVLGEVSGSQALGYVQSKMLQSDEGRSILEEKPRISSGAVDLKKLKNYPEGTLGKAYSNFLEKYGYSPDKRNAVKFVDDFELAYVAQRYREAHDLFHTLLGMPTNMLGEVTIKWVEAIQTKLPMCAAGALLGSVRLAPKFTRAYSTKPIVSLDSSLLEKVKNNEVNPKDHPGVMHVKCVQVPEIVSSGIQNVLEDKNVKDLVQKAAYLERKVQSRLLPVETYQRHVKRQEFWQELQSKFEISDEEVERQMLRKIDQREKKYFFNWQPTNFNDQMCLQYLICRSAGEYAVLKRVFNEIKLRDEDFKPQTLMDFGSGVGTVTWAVHELWGANMKEYYCVDASRHMNELAALILRDNKSEQDSLIKGIYYRQFLPSTPKPYDIVVSSFSFFELPNQSERLRILTTLWNNTKDYLVLIENGTNAGFSVILEARDYLLKASKKYNVDCYVFAPCPHEFDCPRVSAIGKKTPCNFAMKFQHLQIPKKANVTGVQTFSYLILKKGKKPPESERQCRIVREVLKRHKHVICKVCTNNGRLEEVFVSSGNSGKPAYQCMRQSQWGDLIPGTLRRPEIDSSDDSDSSSSSDDSDDSDEETEKAKK